MIVVYGATGTTGTLVARELAARGERPVVAGRDPARLAALARELGVEHRVAGVHDARALSAALAGARVVVNCAGPFLRLGEPVVRAAIDAGVHYLDTAGEQAFVKEVYERYESAARRAGVAVVNACAYEVALGDWAAALAAEASGGPLDELVVAYAVDGFRPTRGTQLSAIESLSGRGFVWDHDRWDPVAPAAETRDVRFPEPFGARQTLSFPSPEVITVPRHIDARRVQTYASLLPDSPLSRVAGSLTSLVGPALPALLQSPLGAFARSHARGETDRARQAETRFAVLAEATRDFRRVRVAVTGQDIYGVTADIAATAARALDGAETRATGVLAPSQLLAPGPTLSAVASRCGLKVVQS